MALGDESCRQPLNPEPVTCKRDAKAVPTSRKAARDWKIRGLCPSRVTRPTSTLAAGLPEPWVICLCPGVADFPDGCYGQLLDLSRLRSRISGPREGPKQETQRRPIPL